MTNVRKTISFVFIAAILTVLLAVPVAAAPGGPKGPRAKDVVSVEGVITSINAGRTAFNMRVLTPGHQRQVGSNTMTVLIQSGTDIHVPGRGDLPDRDPGRPARIQDFRVGDRVHVQALRLDNGTFLAMRVTVQNRQAAPEESRGRETLGQVVQVEGVVIDKGDRSLRVRQANGTVRTVLVTSTTDITGRVSTFRQIRVGDIVVVHGTVNADGTIVARRIDVLRSSAGETTVTGTIVLKNTVGSQFVILNTGQAIGITDATQITSGGRRRSFDDLRIGMTITVVGAPMTVAGVTVGINARRITY